VEELLKNIQALADENRDMSAQVKELEGEVKRLRFEPIIQLTQKMPPCPDDEIKQKEWFAYARSLLDTLDNSPVSNANVYLIEESPPNKASTPAAGTRRQNSKSKSKALSAKVTGSPSGR